MRDFLHMGGYAAYVWSAYGLAAAVLVGMIVHSLLWHRRLLRDLRRRSARSRIETAATALPQGADTGSDAPTRGKAHRESGAP